MDEQLTILQFNNLQLLENAKLKIENANKLSNEEIIELLITMYGEKYYKEMFFNAMIGYLRNKVITYNQQTLQACYYEHATHIYEVLELGGGNNEN